MALIKFGGGVAGISGKIGGTVFARNKAGAFARNWSKPVNPVTPAQAAVRAQFANGSAAWGDLTSADRDTWNSEAALQTRINRFGETYVPSGRQYFLETYNSLAQTGHPTLSVPATGAAPPASLAALALTAEEASNVITILELAFTPPSPATGLQMIVEGAPVSSDAKTNVNTQYRQVGSFAVATSPVDILAAYTSLFGTSGLPGQFVRLRISTLDTATGLRSAQQLISANF